MRTSIEENDRFREIVSNGRGTVFADATKRARCTLSSRMSVSSFLGELAYVCTYVLEAVTLPCIRGSPANRVASGLPRHYTHRHAFIVHPSILIHRCWFIGSIQLRSVLLFLSKLCERNRVIRPSANWVGWIKEESIYRIDIDRNRV